ncbi:MAG: hypothetical protein ACI8RD_005578 [Bacillariaceae sp.]|jgi:hypothetical protein
MSRIRVQRALIANSLVQKILNFRSQIELSYWVLGSCLFLLGKNVGSCNRKAMKLSRLTAN